MHSLRPPFAGDYHVTRFQRQCRRDHNERERERRKQVDEALSAAQADPPFDALGEDAPELSRRLED